jgi:hypothetical protein
MEGAKIRSGPPTLRSKKEKKMKRKKVPFLGGQGTTTEFILYRAMDAHMKRIFCPLIKI